MPLVALLAMLTLVVALLCEQIVGAGALVALAANFDVNRVGDVRDQYPPFAESRVRCRHVGDLLKPRDLAHAVIDARQIELQPGK